MLNWIAQKRHEIDKRRFQRVRLHKRPSVQVRHHEAQIDLLLFTSLKAILLKRYLIRISLITF